MADGTLKLILLGEDRTASKTLRGVGDEAQRTGGILGGLGKAGKMAAGLLAGAAVAAGAAAITLGKQSIDAFAQYEDATQAAGVVFGASMAKITEQAEGAAKTLGMSKSQVIDAATTFGTYGKAAGLAGDDLAKFSTDMTQLAGDMASFRGTSPEQAIEAIGAAMRGETEPIRQYGVMLDDAALRNEALRLGLIKTTKDALTPQQKTLAAQSLILKQTSDAQGDFARSSASVANSTKTAQAQFENLKTTIGAKLAPAYSELMSGLSGAMDWLEKHPEVIDGAIAALELLGGAIMLLVQASLPMIGILVEGFSQLMGVLADMLGALGKVPGFEWATDASDKLRKVSDGAHAVASGIEQIATGKDIEFRSNASYTVSDIKALEDRIKALPTEQQVEFWALVDAGRYNEAEQKLNALEQPRDTTVTANANTAGAKSALTGLEAPRRTTITASANTAAAESAINYTARPRTVKLTVTGTTGGGGGWAYGGPVYRFDVGGRVPGWSPHDRADNIPAWLTAGEYVHPVDTVAHYGMAAMDAIRSKRATVSFSGGGLVGEGGFGGSGRLHPDDLRELARVLDSRPVVVQSVIDGRVVSQSIRAHNRSVR